MPLTGWLQLAALGLALLVAARVLGAYIARVYSDRPLPEDRVFAPLERSIYRLAGVTPGNEQRWTAYARSVLAFSAVSVARPVRAAARPGGPRPRPDGRRRRPPPPLALKSSVRLRHEHDWRSLYSRGGDDQPPRPVDGLAVQTYVTAAGRASPWRSRSSTESPAPRKRRLSGTSVGRLLAPAVVFRGVLLPALDRTSHYVLVSRRAIQASHRLRRGAGH